MKTAFLEWSSGARRSHLGTVCSTDCWLSLQVWSVALTSPVSWSTPLHYTTWRTRAGPGAVCPLRRPPRWTCWTGLRQSRPRRCPEVRAEATFRCPGWARMGLGCWLLFEMLRLPHSCSLLFPLKTALNVCVSLCLLGPCKSNFKISRTLYSLTK